MGAITFVSFSFLCVFLMRDAQLFSAERLPALRWRLGLYWAVMSCYVLAARALGVNGPAEIVTVLSAPLVWGVLVGLHVVALSICLWLRRLRRSDRAWLVALFPTPLLALLLLGVAGGMGSGMQLWTCLLVTLVWTLIVGIAGKLSVLLGGSDSEFAVNFAAASNSMAFALFPLRPFF